MRTDPDLLFVSDRPAGLSPIKYLLDLAQIWRRGIRLRAAFGDCKTREYYPRDLFHLMSTIMNVTTLSLGLAGWPPDARSCP
jgi:hypothetical protein